MIIDYKKLKKLHGKKITFAIGTFDLLHNGHLYFLNKAKKVCKKNKLLVGVISDRIASKIKGDNRPIISEKQRAEMINNLKSVSYVFIAPELTTGEVVKDVIAIVNPEYSVITKSSWQNRKKPYSPKNTKIVIIEEELTNTSTTNIINNIKGDRNE
ncbi:adenylyltransferase/cytidyltransferase family protein [bacterium]|nr:adenylyltransferase/cytidyltransferase family protein [bacterium]